MRVDFGVKPALYPMPVLMLAAYGEDGEPRVMTAAWGGISEDEEISVCISDYHATTKAIVSSGAFTVGVATESTAAACDYVGMVSADKVPDKFKKAGFTAEKSKFVNAPIISELPFCVECELVSYDAESCRLVGKIVNVSADESVLTDGKPDPAKMRVLIYDSFNRTYNVMGEVVAKAYSVGKELM